MWESRVLHSDWLYNLEMGGTLTLVLFFEIKEDRITPMIFFYG